MTVTMQYASEHLDELLTALEGGDSVEVLRPDKPVMRLSGASGQVAVVPQANKRVLGAGRGELRALSDEEWGQIDKEWRKSFESKFGDVAGC